MVNLVGNGGDAGKCYTGSNVKKKAMAQAVAIEASQTREGKLSEFKVKPKKKGKK